MELDCSTEGETTRKLNVTENLLEDAGMLLCNPQTSAMSPGYNLNEWSTRVTTENCQSYGRRVGRLLYFASKSRSNLGLVESMLGYCNTEVTEASLERVKMALRCFEGTKNTRFVLKLDENVQVSARIDFN